MRHNLTSQMFLLNQEGQVLIQGVRWILPENTNSNGDHM